MKDINWLNNFLIKYLTHDITSPDERRKARKTIRETLSEDNGEGEKKKSPPLFSPTGKDYPSLCGKFLKRATGFSKDTPLAFTSCTSNYIPKARVLASSFKKNHPDWEFCLLLGEAPPEEFNMDDEPFDSLILFEDLDIPNYWQWMFRHRVVEVCTAAKGHALYQFVVKEGRDKVLYIDPDIMVFNSLQPLADLLDGHDILLTPHQLSPVAPDDIRAIRDHELCSLRHGTYNLGFIGVNSRKEGQGRQFATWWRDRLHKYCYDDIPNGIFTDQRWCDLIPSFFSKAHIIRDPGYNAAAWNITDRTITRNEEGTYMANDSLLRFYHFTGNESEVREYMVNGYGNDVPGTKQLWEEYGECLNKSGYNNLMKVKWSYINFPDGAPITDEMRMVFRNNSNVSEKFPNPYSISANENFRAWYAAQNL